MYPNKKDKDRRKRDPFDFFGFDDDFLRDLFDDDRFMDDIRKMTEEMMRMFSNSQPGKRFVHGFRMEFGPDGRPRIQEFGNKPIKSEKGEPSISEEREPLTDIIEGNDDVAVTVEIPGVEKHDIDLNVTDNNLEITVNNQNRKYHKLIDLPCEVIPKSTKATYKNGVLDVVIKRQEKKKPGTGYRVNID